MKTWIAILLACTLPAFSIDSSVARSLNDKLARGKGPSHPALEGTQRVKLLNAARFPSFTPCNFFPGLPRNIHPNYIIYDSDFGNDPGDVAALCVLHSLADNGECQIIAVGCATTNTDGPGATDAINTFYGRPDIPVGINKGTALDPGPYPGIWNKAIGGLWPNSFGTNGSAAESATTLYRRLLGAAPPNSVTIICNGQLANLEALRASSADQNSGLSGTELLRQKVRKVVISGGDYPSGNEYNFYTDPTNASNFVNKAICPLRFNGYTVGNAVATGSGVTNILSANHPMRYAYDVWGFAENASTDRASWDQLGTIYGVRNVGQDGQYWRETAGGFNLVAPSGTNQWLTSSVKDQRYIIPQETTANMVALVSNLMYKTPLISSPSNFGVTNLSTNLMASFWKFTEATGGPWSDSVGSVTLTNISGGGTITNVNGAAHFNGFNTGMTAPHTTALNGGNSQYSISCAVKLDTTNGVDHTIIGKGTGTAFDYYFYIPSGGKPALFVYDGAAVAASVGSVTATTALTPNTTNYIECGVIPQYSGNNARLYMRINDGTPVYATTSGTPGTNTSSRIGVGINPGSFGGQVMQGDLLWLDFRRTINGKTESTYIYNGGGANIRELY